MKRQLIKLALAGALTAAAGCAMAQAQAPAAVPTPAVKRVILQKADVVATPAQETMIGTVDIPVGSGNAKHKHNGTEIGYVVSGRLRQVVEGQPDRIIGPGDTFLIPRGVPHQSFLVGDEPVRLVSSWTVDKADERMLSIPVN